MSDEIDIQAQPGTGYVLVMPIGVLSMRTVAAIRTALLELLASSDRVVVDLSRLRLRHPGCVAVFGSAMQQAGGWPDIKLALIGADPRMLTHLARRAGPAVPVADSLRAALVMTDQPPRLARSPLSGPGEPTPSPVMAIAHANPEAAQFIQDWLGVLIEHDAFVRSDLVTTLATFIEHHQDYEGTARALGIHPSTTRFRIHRIGELTQLDLRDPRTLGNLRAAIRVLTRLSDSR